MTKADFRNFFNDLKTKADQNAPEILIGLSIAGTVSAVVLAVNATPKALKRIEAKKQELGVDKLTAWETVKTTWTCYIPTATALGFSTGCALGSQSIHAKRNAAIATAYKISETALSEYREKVVETIGEKKEQAVRDKVAQEQLDKVDVSERKIYATGKGKTLFYDPLSDRLFESDKQIVLAAENRLNKAMMQTICGSTSLNDFYVEIGLKPVDTCIGETLGWNTDHQIDLDIRTCETDDERPCFVIYHNNAPKYDF